METKWASNFFSAKNGGRMMRVLEGFSYLRLSGILSPKSRPESLRYLYVTFQKDFGRVLEGQASDNQILTYLSRCFKG